ncbi:MAG: hypothetical protein ACFFCM_07535 [Promethearchaeota archaeon]
MAKEIFSGIVRGTASSFIIGSSFVIKLDEKFDGIPEEFVVYNHNLAQNYNMFLGKDNKKSSTFIRPEDRVIIKGKIVQDFLEDNMELIRMHATLIYNETLRCGFK